jgi:hypothetical protein
MKYIVKIYKHNGKILVETFTSRDTAERWGANAMTNGYDVLPIVESKS